MNWTNNGATHWNKRAGSTRQKRAGLLLGALGIALIVAFTGVAWWVRNNKVPIDKHTNCPLSGPRAIHLVLIDQSDPITPLQAQRIRQELGRLRDKQAGERIDLYVANGDPTNVLAPILSICSPGQGKDASIIYENPEKIQRDFETKFASVLARTIEDLLNAKTLPSSPLAESIKAAAVNSFGPVEEGKVKMTLTIVSDLVQHSPIHSHFRSAPDFSDLAKSANWRALQSNLKGADVHIYYLLRPTARRAGGQPIQTRAHQLFWEQLLRASNGRVKGLEVI